MGLTINVGNGNNEILINTNSQTNISTGDGNNKIIANTKTKNQITTGDGNNKVLCNGDGSYVTFGDGDNDVVFNGDNFTAEFGDGDNEIKTLDQAIIQGEYTDYTDSIDMDITTIITTTCLNKAITNADVFDCLDSKEREIAKTLDWEAKVDDKPKYIIAQSKDKKYHVYEYAQNNTYNCVNQKIYHSAKSFQWDGQTSDFGEIIYIVDEEQTTTTTYSAEEAKNVTLNFGTGKNTGKISVDVETFKINSENNSTNLNITTGQTTITDTDIITNVTKNVTVNQGYSSKWYSPLIIDYNRDGIVSAQSGIGVDINNDGKADGAATNGDKMLAMSDINGNNEIDGTEVFGNNTIDPFTNKKIEAQNGFEALEKLALSAEEKTGIKIIEGENVNLEQLEKALNTIGVSLGTISDYNVTELESIGELKSINVKDYQNTTIDTTKNETQDIEHRQLGYGEFKDGTKTKINDVWFASVASATITKKLDKIYYNFNSSVNT